MILRLPWAGLKWYFITNRGPKQGVTMNVVTLKVDCQKISNQEQFQNKPEKVNFSNYISTTKKKNQNNSRNFRIIGHPGTLCMELHAPPPVMFYIPQLRFLSSYLRNSMTSHPHSHPKPINPNLKSSNPQLVLRGFTLCM